MAERLALRVDADFELLVRERATDKTQPFRWILFAVERGMVNVEDVCHENGTNHIQFHSLDEGGCRMIPLVSDGDTVVLDLALCHSPVELATILHQVALINASEGLGCIVAVCSRHVAVHALLRLGQNKSVAFAALSDIYVYTLKTQSTLQLLCKLPQLGPEIADVQEELEEEDIPVVITCHRLNTSKWFAYSHPADSSMEWRVSKLFLKPSEWSQRQKSDTMPVYLRVEQVCTSQMERMCTHFTLHTDDEDLRNVLEQVNVDAVNRYFRQWPAMLDQIYRMSEGEWQTIVGKHHTTLRWQSPEAVCVKLRKGRMTVPSADHRYGTYSVASSDVSAVLASNVDDDDPYW